MEWTAVDGIIERALREDIASGDVTTDTIFGHEKFAQDVSGRVLVKEEGVLAGLGVFERVFRYLPGEVKMERMVPEGRWVESNTTAARLQGAVGALLSGERVALNFLQRISGIATKVRRAVEKVRDYEVRVVDTRKTVPGLRVLDKYAVRCGGGRNHRMDLSSGVLIKDNHIAAAGGIREAVERVRARAPHTLRIQVEVETLEQLRTALESGADAVLLDNMEPKRLERAVEVAQGRALLEASGGITVDNIDRIAATGVDVISMGSLTHSVEALDISFKFEGVIKG